MLLSRRSLIRVGAGGAALSAVGALAPTWANTPASSPTPAGPLTIDDILTAPPPAATIPAAPAVLRPSTAATVRRIAFLNLHTDERCSVVYRENGTCVPDAMAQVNKVLRDFRTGEVYPIDPKLLDLLAELSHRMDTTQPFHVISGYRSPKTNAMLNGKSSGVATRSLHMQGKAIDIRLPGRKLADVRDTALDMKRGGVGYYARSDFVHVDTGRVRRW